jgi:hypothetical protein
VSAAVAYELTRDLAGGAYSVNRLAAVSGFSEPTLRRWLTADPLHGELMDMRALPQAAVAARAIRAGHDPAVIRAVNAIPHLTSGLWLVSVPGSARIHGTIAKAAVWIEDRPSRVALISNIGQLILDVDAH